MRERFDSESLTNAVGKSVVPRMLTTARQVIAALGGRQAVEDMFDKSPQLVCSWQKKLPAHKYLEMTEALARRRQKARPELWGQRHFANGHAKKKRRR